MIALICTTAVALIAGAMVGRASARVVVRPPLVLDPEPTYKQIDAALEAVLGSMWTGNADSIGLTTHRSSWRARMRHALVDAAEAKPE